MYVLKHKSTPCNFTIQSTIINAAVGVIHLPDAYKKSSQLIFNYILIKKSLSNLYLKRFALEQHEF